MKKKIKLFRSLFTICFVAILLVSCKSDDSTGGGDDMDPQNPTSFISFTLDGTDYVLTDVTIMIDPQISVTRRVEAVFPNDPNKKILFWIENAAPFNLRQFIYEENGNTSTCDMVGCDRSMNITTNTNSKMEGTFFILFRDTTNNPTFRFSNGVIDVSY
jgi:hypothetical protein